MWRLLLRLLLRRGALLLRLLLRLPPVLIQRLPE
jgi:hypothetical protein